MKAKMDRDVPELQEQYREGRITRREFMRRAALLGVSMSSIGAFLASCSAPATELTPTQVPPPASPPAATPTPTPAPTPLPAGPIGDLTIGVSSFGQDTLDAITGDQTLLTSVLAPMYDFLAMLDPSGKVCTGVAERWEMAPDALSWTFHIRKGITFHDGSPLTAKDVKYSLDQYSARSTYSAFIKASNDHVDILDDYTVRVYTKGTQPYYWRYVDFNSGFAGGMIVPKDYIEKNGLEYFKLHAIGSGPFKFVRHVAGDVMEFEALDKHYRQVPAFKKLSIVLIPEEATRIAMLKTGALDLAEVSVNSAPDLEAVHMRTANLGSPQCMIHFYGTYDPRAKGMPLSDVRVRQALTIAINRAEINTSLFYGKMGAPMPPCMRPTQPEIDGPFWSKEAGKYYYYDLDKAMQLLKDAGYPQGFPIKLYSSAAGGAPYLPKLAEVIQGYWLRIGVKAQIVPVDDAGHKALIRTGPTKDLANEAVGAAGTSSADGNAIPIRGVSGRFWSQGTWNLLQGQVPELETLMVTALSETDDAKRFNMIARAIQLGLDTWTVAVIGSVPSMAAIGPRVDLDLPQGTLGIAQYAENAKHRV